MADTCGGQFESIIARAGFRRWAGVDEAGRGAAAGPLVAAAVVLDSARDVPGLRDSKLLSAAQRVRLHDALRTGPHDVGIAIVSVREIDDRGVHAANIEAMRRAVARLRRRPELALADGFCPSGMPVPTLAIWKGDTVIRSIAAASVVAKVVRDRIMAGCALEHPGYGLEHNKGYLTRLHSERLAALGPSEIHRRSFAPVRRLLSSARSDSEPRLPAARSSAEPEAR